MLHVEVVQEANGMFQRLMENIDDVLFISHGKIGRAVALLQDYVRTENRFSANCRKIFFFEKTKKSLCHRV